MNKRLLAVGALLLALGLSAPARSQTVSPFKGPASTATTNPNLVLGHKAQLASVVASNTTATIYYLKFYNKATAPVCGTDVPKLTVQLPASGGFVYAGQPLLFPLGLGYCITSGYADTDTGAAAVGIIVNLGVTGS